LISGFEGQIVMNEFLNSIKSENVIGFDTMLILGGNPVLARMGQKTRREHRSSSENGILRHANVTPSGFLKTFIPNDKKELSDVQRSLAMAGMTGQHAVRNFYLFRIFLGFVLPTLFLGLIWTTRTGLLALPATLDEMIAGWGATRVLQILTVVVSVGFFGPAMWLRSRVSERQRLIEEHFPNALDLIQISVEAGLGFDAAMIRVGNELEHTSPAISHELLTAQREIQAGRSRDRALMDMAARTGVEEVTSFANVVLQSMQFGTSVSETLTTYADEMRTHRELKAQEKANRLPVQMSAVLASLMLPSLLLLTLGPIIIRYIRFFAG
jgi:tight adherence protein C